jgi:predicted lipoprotein with Yx(FWY)xxD motif
MERRRLRAIPTKGVTMAFSRPTKIFSGAAVIPLAALAVVGYGGVSSAATGSAPTKGAAARTATVGVAKTGLGRILVSSSGHTLYLFKKDHGTKSACFGACAQEWPPLRSSHRPVASGGAKAAMISTAKRRDGKPQVIYNHHPLYLFRNDAKRGDTNGEGLSAFGGRWYAVSPAGHQVTKKGSSGGGGY